MEDKDEEWARYYEVIDEIRHATRQDDMADGFVLGILLSCAVALVLKLMGWV